MPVWIVFTEGHDPLAFEREHDASAFAEVTGGRLIGPVAVLGAVGAALVIDAEADRQGAAFARELAEGVVR